MALSADLCRAQEALHRARAATTLLMNVRTIAESAAAAWATEALCADKRDERERGRSLRASAKAKAQRSREDHGRSRSENPDRGHSAQAGSSTLRLLP